MPRFDDERIQCLQKARYESRKHAMTEMRRARTRRPQHQKTLQGQFHAFRCPHCGFWHVGRGVRKSELRRRNRVMRRRQAKPLNQDEEAA